MKFPDAQLFSLLAWTLRDHAIIVSGAYKFKNTQKRTKDGEWKDLTNEEKLKNALSTLTNRCNMISNQAEFIGEQEIADQKKSD